MIDTFGPISQIFLKFLSLLFGHFSNRLVVEVEMTSSAISKMQLFAAMHVPEVWRHDGESLAMYQWMDGTYQGIESSLQLPGLSSQQINEVLAKRDTIGETKLIRSFRMSLQ